MNRPFQVKDEAGRVYRVVADDELAACKVIANRHNVTVVASRESRDAQDAIRVGMQGADS